MDLRNTSILLSIVIPCFNERSTIVSIVEAVIAFPYKTRRSSLLMTVPRMGHPISWNRKSRRLSLPSFIRNAIREKGGGARTMPQPRVSSRHSDADLEYDPQEYPLLLSPSGTRQT
jgi:hypothetical protein